PCGAEAAEQVGVPEEAEAGIGTAFCVRCPVVGPQIAAGTAEPVDGGAEAGGGAARGGPGLAHAAARLRNVQVLRQSEADDLVQQRIVEPLPPACSDAAILCHARCGCSVTRRQLDRRRLIVGTDPKASRQNQPEQQRRTAPHARNRAGGHEVTLPALPFPSAGSVRAASSSSLSRLFSSPRAFPKPANSR